MNSSPRSTGLLPSAAGLLAVLSASLVPAATLPFIPDSTGAAAPLFDPDAGTLLSPATGGNVTVLAGETLSINTTTGQITKFGTEAFTGTGDTGTTEAGSNGSAEIALFTFNNLSIDSGARIEITGTRPVGMLCRHILAVDGVVSVSGMNAGDSGPGAASLGGYAGGARVVAQGTAYYGLPGDGIPGFGGAGGASSSSGGGGGRTYTDARVIDLRGGGGGGSGGAEAKYPFTGGTSGAGGGGGGGLLLLAQQAIVLGPNAVITAAGGSGGRGTTSTLEDYAGGGGGGAGGAVALCAPGITLNSGSRITLAGGVFGLGAGAFGAGSNGTAGETGRLAIYTKSPLINGGATITATRFDNATTAYPGALDASVPHAGVLNYLNDNNAVATPLFDPDAGTLLSPATNGDVTVLSGEILTINTSTNVITKTGANPFYSLGDTGITAAGSDGSREVALFTFRNLTVNNGAIINIKGAKAAGFLVRNNLTIHGTVDLSGQPGDFSLGAPGPGGYSGGSGTEGTSPGLPGDGVTGFGGTAGVFANGSGGGGGGGRTYTDARLMDLLGGSGGGSGASIEGPLEAYSGNGGNGGGGLLLLAQNTLTIGPTGAILARGGTGGAAGFSITGAGGGGGGGAGGSVALCAPGIALNSGSQINLAGGAGGNGYNMPSGTAGETGRLAIYSKAAPVAVGAVIIATRFDNATAAYPAALTLAGEPPPVITSFTHGVNGIFGYVASIRCQGTPGARYLVEKTTDLTAWTADGNAITAPSTGVMNISRTTTPSQVQKLFWRVRKL